MDLAEGSSDAGEASAVAVALGSMAEEHRLLERGSSLDYTPELHIHLVREHSDAERPYHRDGL